MLNLDFIPLFTDIFSQVETGRKAPEQIKREDKVTSLGIDSVAMMEIIGHIEDRLEIKIADEKLARLQTVGDIEKVVLEAVELRGTARG